MNDVLALCRDYPELLVAKGESVIEESVRTDRLYVLKEGAFEVVRNGVRVVSISEPGAFLGEISAVLGTVPTADVVATQDSTVHVVDNASASVKSNPSSRTRSRGCWRGVCRQSLAIWWTSSASTPTATPISH